MLTACLIFWGILIVAVFAVGYLLWELLKFILIIIFNILKYLGYIGVVVIPYFLYRLITKRAGEWEKRISVFLAFITVLGLFTVGCTVNIKNYLRGFIYYELGSDSPFWCMQSWDWTISYYNIFYLVTILCALAMIYSYVSDPKSFFMTEKEIEEKERKKSEAKALAEKKRLEAKAKKEKQQIEVKAKALTEVEGLRNSFNEVTNKRIDYLYSKIEANGKFHIDIPFIEVRSRNIKSVFAFDLTHKKIAYATMVEPVTYLKFGSIEGLELTVESSECWSSHNLVKFIPGKSKDFKFVDEEQIACRTNEISTSIKDMEVTLFCNSSYAFYFKGKSGFDLAVKIMECCAVCALGMPLDEIYKNKNTVDIEKVKELKELLASNVISEEEYCILRKQL